MTEATQHLETIIAFIRGLPIEVRFRDLEEPTFLPGILIEDGAIVLDPGRLAYPGDLLHEAGHIALEPTAERIQLYGNVQDHKQVTEALEIGVILWTWAASQYLGLPDDVVFHAGGYKGQSDAITSEFRSGNFVGLPLLEWMGLTSRSVRQIEGQEVPPFPHMTKWLRD